MYPAYEDVLERHRFDCRYIAFIDLDEFLYPKTGQSVIEVVDEILSRNPNAAALGVNWQCFGSNGLETADYSLGVLERFTRRAQSDWDGFNGISGNFYRKTISNPRLVRYALNPHYAFYFDQKSAVNSDGGYIPTAYYSKPILVDKIVVNHYYTKSKEEYLQKKMPKGSCCMSNVFYNMEDFQRFDRNEEFDDGILSYRAAREENFSLESDADRIRRVERALVDTLTQCSPFDAPADFFVDKLETFLTCRAVAEQLGTKIGSRTAEEYALVWIYRTFIKSSAITHAEGLQFLNALPDILARPFPMCRKIKTLTQQVIIPTLRESLKNGDIFSKSRNWSTRSDLHYIERLLRLIN